MLLAGLNDSEAALKDIATAMAQIRPDEIHLVLPTRPPCEPWVRPADEEGILRARAILGSCARLVHPAEVEFERGAIENPLEAAAAIVTRHPMSDQELRHALSLWGVADIPAAIDSFEKSGKGKRIERYGTAFWRAP